MSADLGAALPAEGRTRTLASLDESERCSFVADSRRASVRRLLTGEISCASCGAADPDFACSRCQTVRYCTRACQRSHWACHKATCRWTHFTVQRPSEPRPSDAFLLQTPLQSLLQRTPRESSSNWLPQPCDAPGFKSPWSMQKLAHEKWEHPELEETVRLLDVLTDRLQATERLNRLELDGQNSSDANPKPVRGKDEERSSEKAIETQIRVQASPQKRNNSRLGCLPNQRNSTSTPIIAETDYYQERPGLTEKDEQEFTEIRRLLSLQKQNVMERCVSDDSCHRTISGSTMPGNSPKSEHLDASPMSTKGLLESAAQFATSLGCTMRSPRKRAGQRVKDLTPRSGEKTGSAANASRVVIQKSNTWTAGDQERKSICSQVPTPVIAGKTPTEEADAQQERGFAAFPALLGGSRSKVEPLQAQKEPMPTDAASRTEWYDLTVSDEQSAAKEASPAKKDFAMCLEEAAAEWQAAKQGVGGNDHSSAIVPQVDVPPITFPRPARLARPDF